MIEFDQVRDEINSLFMEAWNTQAGAVVGYIPKIRWQGVQQRDLPRGSMYWARVSKKTIFEKQATLSTCEGKPGQKRYTASGLVFVQLFCPKSDTQAFVLGSKLAKIARNAFRGKTTSGKIWFRNVCINELNPEELYERFNVVTEFEYDELG